MKRFRLISSLMLLVAGVVLSAPTWADNCVDAPQPDGTVWRTCVDDAGNRYCESCSNGVCSRVSCDS